MYHDSIVDIRVVFTRQIRGDFIGVMDVFFYVNHLFLNGRFTCKCSLEIVLLCTPVSICAFHLRVLCCVDLPFVYVVYVVLILCVFDN
jgi:hypothetical protein